MAASYTSSMYTGTLPMPVPGKEDYSGYYQDYQGGHTSYSVSPPESENVSSASGSATYGQSGYATSVSYAGSMQGEYDTTASVNVDLNDFINDGFHAHFDTTRLDESVSLQAKTSGQLNAEQRELLELQQRAQARLSKMRSRVARGMREAREVEEDLKWSQKTLGTLNTKAANKYPKEYKKAHGRYPSPDY